jgi:AcrR family transcriptional regulator
MRRDARRNQDALVDVAREVFAAQGVDAPMTTIARSAGLSSATLYRHFPTRAALTAAVFTQELETCATTFDAALKNPDSRQALIDVLEEIAAHQVRDPAFADAFLGQAASLPALTTLRHRSHRALRDLVARAQADGGLRSDFTVDDVFVLLHANRGLARLPAEESSKASRRLTSLFIHASMGS